MEQLTTHNDIDIDIMGTSLVGLIQAQRHDLEKVFGDPISDGLDFPTQWEWHISFPCGTVATIYDRGYIPTWHGGGMDTRALELVEAALALSTPSAIHIEGRLWQDTNGNTYHVVSVTIDGKAEWVSDITYGYEDHYLTTASEWLTSAGVLPEGEFLHRWCSANDIACTSHRENVKTQRALETGGAA